MPSRALSKGPAAFTPSEVFHGKEAKLPLDESLQPAEGFVRETDAEVEEYMCVIKAVQERACEWISDSALITTVVMG